ncbi:GNAT family N-acetyltransferase [Acanthopleuribacter pedis]|uniref:GNAT family N-acetyltransferase n=1 Tax=Acanthopleuribacter pedis TaxID=442870 RepID=A0A8J7QJ83_9BACT|nr:GNAT family N-acetyltransferase [Acanthopleuribacter pedis]MBO1319208.1 GNAT family N-acetyltransferase [Acanthopleuribacter pedis]
MNREQVLSFSALREHIDDFDQAVLKTAGIDFFCSSAAWILPAVQAFYPESRARILRIDDHFLALVQREVPGVGSALLPLESSWCLAAPLVGPDSQLLADVFYQTVRHLGGQWRLAFLSGLQNEQPVWQKLVTRLHHRFALFRGSQSVRRVASLEGGVDGFLARRTSKFRKNLRRNQRTCRAEQLRFEVIHGALAPEQAREYLNTFMQVEALSWKGLSEQGVNQGEMYVFYREMVAMLGPRDRFRAVTAHLDGKLVGFLFGGLLGPHFRGLQFSFDDRYRALGIGNALQMKMIEHLCGEGTLTYDLGADMAYKQRWGEIAFTTDAMVIRS